MNPGDAATVPADSALHTSASGGIARGFVAKNFEPVREVFEQGFRDGQETGAALAVQLHGKPVVDLWGGLRAAGSTQAWQENTLALVFSTSKGLTALALALARARGWLDYEARVADYWPEFAQNGKRDITVRQLLSHQAGLSGVDHPLTLELLADHDALAVLLAREKPAWVPGTRQGYHPVSLGLYQNELMRRVDPQHRSLGEVLQQELAAPLDAEVYLGLPDQVPDDQLAPLRQPATPLERWRAFGIYPWRFLFGVMWPSSLTGRAFSSPRPSGGLEAFCERPWLRIQMGSVNAVATARGIARLYGEFATGAARLGISRRILELLEAPAVAPSVTGFRDAVLHLETRYSLGFWKPCAEFDFGSDARAYGAPGAGGSVGFADPATGLGFAYVPNRLGLHMLDDPRARRLREAVYRCVSGLR
jgi:CubicO group peptidase (beta-lactamase class C family)